MPRSPRTEQLLQDADGDLWAEADLLKPLSVLYALDRPSCWTRARPSTAASRYSLASGLSSCWPKAPFPPAWPGLITADPVAAERYARAGLEIFRVMGQGEGSL